MKKLLMFLFASFALFTVFACDNSEKSIIELDIWTYYNTTDAKTFDSFVESFNETAGKDLGIKANHIAFNTTTNLQNELTKSARKEVGALDFPEIFQTYGDFLTTLDGNYDISTPLDEYFDENDLAKYVGGFLNDGRIYADNSLRIIPFAKSTEILMLNKNVWDSFNDAIATPYTYDDLLTMESIVEISEVYADYAVTQLNANQKSFFARDSVANEFYNVIALLGNKVFTLNADGTANFDKVAAKAMLKVLYDYFFTPYMSGYFAGRARTEDFAANNFAAFVGSISGVKYIPADLEMVFLPAPVYQNKDKYTIQQGAGYAVTKNENKDIIKACASFLKYAAADSSSNAAIASSLGYIPALRNAVDYDLIAEKYLDAQLAIMQINNPQATTNDVLNLAVTKNQLATFKTILNAVVDTSSDYILHSMKPFAGLSYIRNIFDYSIWGKEPTNDISSLMADFKNANHYLSNPNETYTFDIWADALIIKIEAALAL